MQYEREYEGILNSQGYITQRVKGSTKWNKNVDFFNKFDIIGFKNKKKYYKSDWILVQVKSEFRNKTLKELKEWKKSNNPPFCKCLLVIRKKYISKGKWRVIEIY